MSLRHLVTPSLPRVTQSIDCPVCCGTLAFHQPDPGIPQRLLATCGECRSWFLAADGVMGLLPDEDDLLDDALHAGARIRPSRN